MVMLYQFCVLAANAFRQHVLEFFVSSTSIDFQNFKV